MKMDGKLLSTVTVAICCWPVLANAQDAEPDARTLLDQGLAARPDLGYTSEVEIGGAYVSTDSYKFGEYTGLKDEGPYVIGGMTVRQRAPFDGESTEHWEATGWNLGLESRSLNLEYGHQGEYEVFLNYDQIPRYQINNAQTPYRGDGHDHLTLPAGLINSGTSSSTISNLDANLRSIDIETKRTDIGGGLTWHLSKELSLSGVYEHEFKEGTDTIAGVFGTTGGNPLAAILPEPIDYEEDQLEVSLGYVTDRFQAELAYNGSWFANNNDSLRWDNPYTNAAWPTIPTEGRMALPPDNQAHRISLSGGYNLADNTRFTGVFSYGWMLQDESFQPYTINPALPATALPTQSLDGEINNLLIDVSAWTRPMPKLDLQARYRYNDRDNKTPRNVYDVVSSDTRVSGDQYVNLPYSTEQNLVNLDSTYRITPRTRVTVGYDFDQTKRTFTELTTSREHTGRVKVASRPLDNVSGAIEYAYTLRDSPDDYQGNAPLLDSLVGAASDDFENHPDLRKFYLANRHGSTVSGSLSFLPHEQVSVGLSGTYSFFDYDDGVYGLRDFTHADITLDASYSPTEALSGYVFYTYELQDMKQDGIQFASFTPIDEVLGNDPDLRWSMDTRDQVHTAGTRWDWHVIENKLDLGVEYAFSMARTSFDPKGGADTNPATPLPDVKSTLHTLGVNAEYHVREDASFKLGYWFQSLSTDDFALDGVGVDTVDQVLGFGQGSANYTAHVVALSFNYKF